MSRFEYNLMHVANALVIVTGLIYGWMRYFMKPAGDFSVVNHPSQPLLQHLHILVAPFLLLLIGHFLYRHAWAFWKSRKKEGRRSGALLVILMLPMTFSGYGLQVAVSEGMRSFWIGVHVVTSLLWILIFVIHFLTHRVRKN